MSSKRVPKIALEEAFTIPELTWKSKWYFNADSVEQLNTELLDLHEIRAAKMKELNIEYMVLSLTAPGPQDEIDPVKAHSLAQRSNDYLAAEVKKDPSHFGGFASLSMHDPETALREARRAIAELGLQGIIVNDFQNIGEDEEDIAFYDQPNWDPFWAEVEALGVTLYIHPRLTTPNVRKALLRGREEITGSPFFFGVGVSIHVLGLHCNGVFDRFPKLSIMIGHMGEHITLQAWRINHRLFYSAHRGQPRTKKTLQQVMKENIYVTTSGNFSTSALKYAIAEYGVERVLFSIDYPYEDMAQGADWFDNIVELNDEEKAQVASSNAKRVLKLQI